MNVRIIYTAPCEISIHFCEGHELESAVWSSRFNNLQDAIDMGKYILRYVYPPFCHRHHDLRCHYGRNSCRD